MPDEVSVAPLVEVKVDVVSGLTRENGTGNALGIPCHVAEGKFTIPTWVPVQPLEVAYLNHGGASGEALDFGLHMLRAPLVDRN